LHEKKIASIFGLSGQYPFIKIFFHALLFEQVSPLPATMAFAVREVNKIGKLVREDSEIGKIIASREHIFVNDVNVRKTLRDLGELILWNSEQKDFDMDSLIQLVETSNRQKRVVRIVERGVTRVTEPNVSMVLKSAELILLMSGIVNILNCKESQKWEGWSWGDEKEFKQLNKLVPFLFHRKRQIT
jgi:hypothetical protein